ncbi:hypothetical protein [Caulobacter endophyticus]|uniref:hypothetical protein n=1 Tax=Caulobacter endophyticus TaxID=2172652 RepID=UPI00240F92B1|nr:hypothetical protein [Caulobacter endophyticus]MDG2530305.1 hypothetical protein [Caulobacter endophyticus]
MELVAALHDSAFGAWARGSSFAYPLANLLHLAGLVLLVGAIGLLDLRLAGAFRALPVAALSRALTPMAVAGLVLMVPSGLVMFAADAKTLAMSGVFRWKLALIAAGLVNAAAFRLLWGRRLSSWDLAAPPAARVMALGSLVLWVAVGTLGRLIAYG